MGKLRYSSTYYYPHYYKAVGGQLHTLDALPCGKEQMVPAAVGEAGKSVPELVYQLQRNSYFLLLVGLELKLSLLAA
jgi:hypothetical protein